LSLERIKDITSQVLEELDNGEKGFSRTLRLKQRWKEVVGENLSEHLYPIGFKGNVLEVGAYVSTWLNEAQFFEGMLRENAKRVTGIEVREVRFTLIKRREQRGGANGSAEQKKSETRELSSEEENEINNALESCKSGILREKLRRIFRLSVIHKSNQTAD